MKLQILLCLLTFASVKSIAQTSDTSVVFSFVEQMPEFSGGDKALENWVASHINYNNITIPKGEYPSVIVKFIVTVDGSVKKPVIIKGYNKQVDDEVIRVINLLPKFKPGMQNNIPVQVYFSVPIRLHSAVHK
jgi:protein TonB